MRNRIAKLVWFCALFAAAAAQAVMAVPPTRPEQHRKIVPIRIAGIEYVRAIDFAAEFGLKVQTAESGRRLVLKNALTTIELDSDTRECSINGQRVFLGWAVRVQREQLHVSRIDAEKLLAPILFPGGGEARVPCLKIIVLDPGHGGKDAGKSNDRLRLEEKILTLDTAQRLKKIFEATGYTVILTRSDDRQLASDKITDLQRRAEIANRAHADLFISLHYNSVEIGADRVTGVEVFTMTPQSQTSTGDSGKIQEDDFAKIANPGNENDHWNTLLGYLVQREFLRDLRVADRGLKRARWAVLRQVTCPAILVESGYLSNASDAQKLAMPAYRQKIAEAIADGVVAYANALEGVRRQRASDKH